MTSFSSSVSCLLKSASGLTFVVTGRYDLVELKCEKNSAHFACLEFILQAVFMYSRFLSLVYTRNGSCVLSSSYHKYFYAILTVSNSQFPMLYFLSAGEKR